MSDYLAQVVRQRDAAVERAQRAEQLLAAAEDELQKRRGRAGQRLLIAAPVETLPAEAGNAEDCPACSERRDLPYPFLCPGHPLAACVCTGTAAGLELCTDCPGHPAEAAP